jgi:hypothetical protein
MNVGEHILPVSDPRGECFFEGGRRLFCRLNFLDHCFYRAFPTECIQLRFDYQVRLEVEGCVTSPATAAPPARAVVSMQQRPEVSTGTRQLT